MIEVVGVPATGVASLPPELLAVAHDADVLISSARLLDGLDDLDPVPTARRVPWPTPLRSGLPGLFEKFATAGVVVLATGDPLVSGVGSTLIDLLGAHNVRIHPAVSSVALARARMGWPAEECAWVSLVGRPVGRLTPYLTPGARLLVLSADEHTPGQVAAFLTGRGLGAARMVVLGNLGTAGELRADAVADTFSLRPPRLNIVAVHLPPGADDGTGPFAGANALLGREPGRPDDAFHSDGQLTKRDVRASALSRLRPTPGATLWDLGAGTGSVALEWCLHDARCRAVAVEQNADRAARLTQNALELGADLEVLTGDNLALLPGLADRRAPDAVFIGGGASIDLIEQCVASLAPGGRLVAHAVTLGTEQVLLAAYERHAHLDRELHRISVETARPLGAGLSWTPARAVVQLTIHRRPPKETSL